MSCVHTGVAGENLISHSVGIKAMYMSMSKLIVPIFGM